MRSEVERVNRDQQEVLELLLAMAVMEGDESEEEEEEEEEDKDDGDADLTVERAGVESVDASTGSGRIG